MIKTEDPKDQAALFQALVTLEQIAKRSRDKSSQALADGAAADLRARLPAELLSFPA